MEVENIGKHSDKGYLFNFQISLRRGTENRKGTCDSGQFELWENCIIFIIMLFQAVPGIFISSFEHV